jgi:CSLREA domain-containing protein
MRLGTIAAVLCAALLALAGPAAANTFNVTTTDDDSGACDADCSLREAVDAANANAGADTINVPAGHYLLTSQNVLTILDDTSIVGADARGVVVDGGGQTEVFDNETGTSTISHLTITGGSNPDQGGGVFNDAALTLDDVAVVGNTATNTDPANFGAQGGGIFNNNQMTLTHVLIANNTAQGGVSKSTGGQGGGLFANDHTDLTNVTISGNQATAAPDAQFPDGQGGGIFANDVTTLHNVTITNNSGSGAADNAAGGVELNDHVTFLNTIVAGNTRDGAESDCVVLAPFAVVVDGGHNLTGDTSCQLTGAGDLQSTNPLLGTLANNGGGTDTHALLAGSPAINAADAAQCPADDQRFLPRPALGGCDIGAFEVQSAAAVTPPAPPPAAVKDTTKPSVTVAGVRAACVTRTVAVRVHASDASGVKSTRVTLDGKRLRTKNKTSFTLKINVRKLKAGRHVLRITTTDGAGNTTTARRTITRCAKRAAKPRRRVAPRFTG